MNEPHWLAIGRELKALSQIGLTFAQDPFDRQRYERIRELAATLIAQGAGVASGELLQAFILESGYATPRVDVRAAVFAQDRILLVREVSDGAWTLPGGWADVHEPASQCVAREAAEESGFQVTVRKLAAVHDFRKRNRPHHLDAIYKMFFLCDIVGGAPRPSIETSEVDFFSLDALPTLSTGRTTSEQIELMFRHAADPGLATDFD